MSSNPDGTAKYFIENINRKLCLLKPQVDEEGQELIDKIIDTDIPELIELTKKEAAFNKS